MPAPIQRYSDPRLYGAALVKPFDCSYQWIRTIGHPWHTKCNIITECAVRAMKLLTGIAALSTTAIPALIGRAIQVIHYHSLSDNHRANPPEVVVDGLRLPHIGSCSKQPPKRYHGTTEDAAIQIIRWGFNPNKTATSIFMVNGVYVSDDHDISANYGKDHFYLSVDLRKGETATLTNDQINQLTSSLFEKYSNKEIRAKVTSLFLLNGYRAIQNNYHSDYGLAILDPSCITINKIVERGQRTKVLMFKTPPIFKMVLQKLFSKTQTVARVMA